MYKSKVFWVISLAFGAAVVSFLTVFIKGVFFGDATVESFDGLLKMTQSVSFIVAAYGVFFTVFTGTQQSIINSTQRKKEAAFSLVNQWDSDSLLAARTLSRNIKKEHKKLSSDELIERIISDDATETSIANIFNFAEKLRLSVEHDLADKVILSSLAYTVKDIMKRFEDYYHYCWKNMEGQEQAREDYASTIRVFDECISALKQKK